MFATGERSWVSLEGVVMFSTTTHRAVAVARRTSTLALALVLGLSFAPAAGANVDTVSGVIDVPQLVDTFERTVESGWGAADLGGGYTQGGAGRVSVAGGMGLLADVPAGKHAQVWTEAVSSDQRSSVDVSYLAVPNRTYAAIELRRQPDGSSYRARLVSFSTKAALEIHRVDSTGQETVLVGTTPLNHVLVGGQSVTLAAEIQGTDSVSVRAKAWIAGTTEPTAWLIETTDSTAGRISSPGRTGIYSYTSAGVSAATTRFDNLAVTVRLPATPQDGVGSVPLGEARYAIPAGSLFVDPASGDDAAAGTQAKPLRTVATALRKAPADATVVLRAGTYHESLSVTKAVTLQSFPGEQVVFDGSVPVTEWARSGAVWVSNNWTASFDNSPSFTRGANSRFVGSQNPMAAHPDQVFIDGAQLQQVADGVTPAPGQFSVNRATKQLLIGSDPTAKQVRASVLQQAFLVSAKVTLRGFGIQRYATSMYQIGTVYLGGSSAGSMLENLVVLDSAAQALSLNKDNITVRKVTVDRSALTGIHANHANGLVVEQSLITNSNHQWFNTEPTAGGMKITSSRNVIIRGNEVTDTKDANGIWMDMNVVGVTIADNVVRRNGKGVGIEVEASVSAVVAGNVVTDAKMGVYIFDSSKLVISNNEFGRMTHGSVFLSQDGRRLVLLGEVTAENPLKLQDIRIENNIFGANVGPYGFQVYALDKETREPASNMNISIKGNWFYTRPAGSGQPGSMVVWGGSDNVTTTRYETPAALNTGLGKSWNNSQIGGAPSIESMVGTTRPVTSAVPLDATVAQALGQPVGSQVIGLP